MSARTIRLDEETDSILQQLVSVTGLSVSAVLKKGLVALQSEMADRSQPLPYEIYQELDLGPGGYAIAPSTQTRRGVQDAIRRKLKR